mgnify:CR=1 FL=1
MVLMHSCKLELFDKVQGVGFVNWEKVLKKSFIQERHMSFRSSGENWSRNNAGWNSERKSWKKNREKKWNWTLS